MDENQSGHPQPNSGVQPGAGGHEAFIPAGERPILALNPEQPISELRVRDLQQIVAGVIRQNGSKLLLKPENETPPPLKSGKDMGQEQPGDAQVGTPAPGVVNQLTASLNQMAVNQMALTRELAALRAEVEQLKNK